MSERYYKMRLPGDVLLYEGDLIRAYPAAGEWQTDLSRAPLDVQLLVECDYGSYRVHTIYMKGVLNEHGVKRFAIINPPVKQPMSEPKPPERTVRELMWEAHATAISKGFWDNDRNDAECIALMHSELSEALEALRHGNPPDKNLPHLDNMTVEFADLLIRVFDTCEARGLDLPRAIEEKMAYNKSREYRHGKKF